MKALYRLLYYLSILLAMLGFHSFNRHTGKFGVSDPCPPVPAFRFGFPTEY